MVKIKKAYLNLGKNFLKLMNNKGRRRMMDFMLKSFLTDIIINLPSDREITTEDIYLQNPHIFEVD